MQELAPAFELGPGASAVSEGFPKKGYLFPNLGIIFAKAVRLISDTFDQKSLVKFRSSIRGDLLV